MNRWSPELIVGEDVVEYWKGNCNRYTNGQCSSRVCLVRGGWKSGPPDYSMATCPEHETVRALTNTQVQPES